MLYSKEQIEAKINSLDRQYNNYTEMIDNLSCQRAAEANNDRICKERAPLKPALLGIKSLEKYEGFSDIQVDPDKGVLFYLFHGRQRTATWEIYGPIWHSKCFAMLKFNPQDEDEIDQYDMCIQQEWDAGIRTRETHPARA
jgi:hypothetical protein